MNSKITFHLLAFFLFASTLYSQFNVQKYWNTLFQGFKQDLFYSVVIMNYLSTYSISIISNFFRHESAARTNHPSYCTTSFKYEFCYV